jgi:hypothetical protein
MNTSGREVTARIERVAIASTIVFSAVLGVALYALSDRVAAALGAEGRDGFAYRAGGAAFLGYAVALVLGWGAEARALRILLPASVGAAVATAVAAAIAVVGGHSGTAPLLILGGAVVSAVLVGYGPQRRIASSTDGGTPDIPSWLVAFFVWGVVASALFGLGGLLLGSTFGTLTGAHGTDDVVYRLAGAATMGIFVGSLLTLRSRNWREIRLVAVLGFVTNLLTLIGVPIVVAGGDPPALIWLIGAAAAFNVGGLGLALLRQGR